MKKENQELVIILPENMENIPVRIIRNAQEEELVIKFIRPDFITFLRHYMAQNENQRVT